MQARITPNSVLEVLRRGAQEVNPLMVVASVIDEQPGAYDREHLLLDLGVGHDVVVDEKDFDSFILALIAPLIA